MKLRIKKFNLVYPFDYYLLLITPIVDTINGLFLMNNDPNGISIGTFYRLFLIIYILLNLINSTILIWILIPLVYFLLNGIIRGELMGSGLMEGLTYSMKWVFPIILIAYYSFYKKNRAEINKYLVRCLNFWCYFVPLSLILEYIFKIGNNSYYDAGFKGLYYSTNDIAMVLIVLFIYSLYRAFELKRFYVLATIMNFLAIIILSTKSSVFFAILFFIFMVLGYGKIRIKNLVALCILGLSSYFIMSSFFTSSIELFILRYNNMWINSSSISNNWFSNFLFFATSGRTNRISEFFSNINVGNIILNMLFGWIYPDNIHVIEMDWYDLLCQYGVIGLFILLVTYTYFLVKSKMKAKPYNIIICICFIYSFFAGHVINGAFSGTIFSIIFSLLIINGITKTNKR